jgi:phage gpG-like protein
MADLLRAKRQRAATDAPLAAVRALSQAGETAVKVTLTSSSHTAGTTTPSDPGQPPSLITGNLRRSVHRTTARVTGPGMARCALGAMAKYAAVHEFGPVTIHARNFPQLGNPKVGFFGREVTIPKRPYVVPAMKLYQQSGMARQVCEAAWMDAMGI